MGEATGGMVKVSGKALAAGKIEANVSGAIPAASALPLTSVVSFPSQATSPEVPQYARTRNLVHYGQS